MSGKPASSDRLIVVGVLSGAHGVRGDVRVKSFTDDPEAIFDLGPLLSDKGEAVLVVKAIRPGKDHFIVTPKTSRQKEEWDAMRGTRLHVRRSQLPPPEDDEFYIEDLVGLPATDEGGERIGIVKAVQNFGAGDLVEIQPDARNEKSYFVPFTMKDVPEVHFSPGHVVIHDAKGWADQSGMPEGEES